MFYSYVHFVFKCHCSNWRMFDSLYDLSQKIPKSYENSLVDYRINIITKIFFLLLFNEANFDRNKLAQCVQPLWPIMKNKQTNRQTNKQTGKLYYGWESIILYFGLFRWLFGSLIGWLVGWDVCLFCFVFVLFCFVFKTNVESSFNRPLILLSECPVFIHFKILIWSLDFWFEFYICLCLIMLSSPQASSTGN